MYKEYCRRIRCEHLESDSDFCTHNNEYIDCIDECLYYLSFINTGVGKLVLSDYGPMFSYEY